MKKEEEEKRKRSPSRSSSYLAPDGLPHTI
jgi:hypothetical protein